MPGTKNNIAHKSRHKSTYSTQVAHKMKHTRKSISIRIHFPNSVPVSNADRLKKTKTSQNQKKEGSAVSNRIRCVPKPIAVRSKNLITSIKSSNVLLLNGDMSTEGSFDVPATSGGSYLDTAATRFSFNV